MRTSSLRFAETAGARTILRLSALTVLGLASLTGLAVSSCSSTPNGDSVGGPGGARALTVEPISEPVLLDPAWAMEVAFEGEVRINGVAAGDLDAGRPGDELATVDRLGRIRILHREAGSFAETELPRPLSVVGTVGAQLPGGELVQVAVGDIDPSSVGDEIVAVGKAEGSEDDPGLGMVRVLSRVGLGGAWVERRAVTPGLVHAIAVGDVLPDRAGLEFVFAGFFGEALVGYIDEVSGTLLVDSLGVQHKGNAKGVCLTADGLVLACDDGNTVRYRRTPKGAWTLVATKQHGAPLARIAAFDDEWVAVCGNDGTFRLVGGQAFNATIMLHRVENRLRGAVVVDIDPSHPGVETCTAGYDGEIRVVYLAPADRDSLPSWASDAFNTPSMWTTTKKSVARDTAKIHHLTTGSFDGLGQCLVSCGYSGDVLVVHPKR